MTKARPRPGWNKIYDGLYDQPVRQMIECPVCGKTCKWVAADPDEETPSKFGGWYCEPCDVYAETDVEVED